MRISIITMLLGLVGCAYNKSFERTSIGSVVIRDLPASKVITARADGNYYGNSDKLFMTLFGYIRQNKVSMTVPVEGGMEKGYMRFFIGKDDADKALESSDTVTVSELPPRKVASIAGKGKYSEENIKAQESKLTEWLEQNNEYTAVGQPYGIFWNSPFVPNSFKKFEIHIPVSERKTLPK